MNHDNDREHLAKERAKKVADRLFGNRSKEQEEAFKAVKSIGSPDDLIRPDNKNDKS